MRRTLEASLQIGPTDRETEPLFDAQSRAPTGNDITALAALMLAAYRGTTDDAGETLEDAVAEVTRLYGNAYGTFDLAASVVVGNEGALVAATLITRFQDEPFVAFSMTHPMWKRRGLARAGLLRAMQHLRTAGETRLRLMVTGGNSPAEALYESLGFIDPNATGDGIS